MTDVAKLGFEVDSKQVDKASSRLDKLSSKAGKVETATGNMATGFAKMIVPLAALTSAIVGAKSALDTFSKFEKLNNQLVTATGSTESAALQFESLNRLASSTPFVMDEVVTSFIKLKNLGLDPSEAALISYGNTASAMGKDLDSLIEAVADATVGEFERLKSFGIKAKSEGDKVSFTFQGVTTTIGKNASEIQRYLRDIGDNQFSGSMERQTDSVETSFSNLGAATDRLVTKIASESGLVGAAKKAAVALTDLFNSVSGMPRSIQAVESEITRLTAALEKAGTARQRNSLRAALRDLREELQLSRSISSDSNEISTAISRLDSDIERYKQAVAKIGLIAPSKNKDTRRGVRKNPLFEQYEKATKDLSEAVKNRKVLIEKLETIKTKQDEALGDESSTPKATDNLKKLIEQLKEERDTLGYTAKQIDLYRAAKGGATKAQLESISAYHDAINAYDKAQKQQELGVAITNNNKTATQLYKEELQKLNDLLNAGTISLETYQQASRAAAEEFAPKGKTKEETDLDDRLEKFTQYTGAQKRLIKDLGRFEKMSGEERAKTALSALTEMTGAFAGESKKAFEINKQLRTAQAIIDGIGAVQAAYAYGSATGGPVGGALAAGAAAIFTAAQVKQIQSQEFQGGGSINRVTVAPSSPYSSQEAKAPEINPVGGSSNLADTPLSAKSSAPIINLNDYRTNGEDVQVKTRRNASGQQEVDLIIRDKVTELANTGQLDDVFQRNYGLQRSGVTR